MKNLFNLDNPFLQFLARIGDMILVNFLFLICSLPVITIGASLTALHKVGQDMSAEEERSSIRTFFRAFRENFKQATAAWLLVLIFFIGMGCNLLLIAAYLTGLPAQVCKWLLYLVIFLMLSITAYLFPLIARYENTLRQHFINASVLAVVKLPRTVLAVALNVLPLAVAYLSIPTFIRTLVFWFTLGFSMTSYITGILFQPVFTEIEAPDGPASESADAAKHP